ncbi:MAG TPA: molecular chaperone TorD family protein [Rhodocyclaceae bacterium]
MNAALAATEFYPLDAGDQVRADVYRVLARLFRAAPDGALLDALAESASGADDELGKHWNALCAAAARHTASELEDEYASLFLGIGEPKVMLYGSWHQAGSLMDMPLARLRDDLAELGFARQEEVREPEDHIAALLEVMAMLVGDNRPQQTEFFRRHLASWHGALCQRLEAEANDFYRAVAGFTRCYLDGEAEQSAR